MATLQKQSEGEDRLGCARLTQDPLSYQLHRLPARQTGVLCLYHSHTKSFCSVTSGVALLATLGEVMLFTPEVHGILRVLQNTKKG